MTTLGIDLAVRAAHVATLTNDRGEVMWTRRRFYNRRADLVELSQAAGPAEQLTVVMEPTRNAWVLVAAHFMAHGAKVVLVAREQSSDLRRYYTKHTKNDRLDSQLLARLPLLHPDGLSEVADLGPADALKRSVRRRVNLVAHHLACGSESTPCWICSVRLTSRRSAPGCQRVPWRSSSTTVTREACADWG